MTAEDSAWAAGPLAGGVLGSVSVTLIYWGSSAAGIAAALFGKLALTGKEKGGNE
jgi:hypothetical protein